MAMKFINGSKLLGFNKTHRKKLCKIEFNHTMKNIITFFQHSSSRAIMRFFFMKI